MPPAIIAAAIAIGASAAASAAIITATTAFYIAAAATIAGALLTKTSVPSVGSYTSQAERKQVLRSATAAQTRIYGRTIVSGVLFFAEEQAGNQTDGELVYLAIAIAGHEVDHIGQIWLGDDTIETFGDYASYEVHNNRTTADPYMLANCPSWKSDMIGRGICWLRVTLKYDSTKFPAGVPNIKAEVYGAKCYDPRNGLTQYTENAAICILDYYRSVLGVVDSDLNMDEFIMGANICDEVIAEHSEARYRLCGIFDLSDAIASVLDDMHAACGGEPTYIAGMHGILVGAYYGPATLNLTESQLISDIKIVPETSQTERINVVTGTFIDPNQQYVETDFAAVIITQWIEEDGNEYTQDMKFRFVISEFQAQRLANIVLMRKRLGRTIELTMNMSGYQYRPGYYVNLTIPSLGINGVEFRITKWGLDPLGGVTITLREEIAAVWGDAVGVPIDRPDLTNLPSTFVRQPTNLSFTPVATNDETNYQGILSWTNPSVVNYNQVVVRNNAGVIYSNAITGNSVRLNGLAQGSYTATVRAVAVNGQLSSVSSLAFTIAVNPKYAGDIYANNGYFKGTIYAGNIVGTIAGQQFLDTNWTLGSGNVSGEVDYSLTITADNEVARRVWVFIPLNIICNSTTISDAAGYIDILISDSLGGGAGGRLDNLARADQPSTQNGMSVNHVFDLPRYQGVTINITVKKQHNISGVTLNSGPTVIQALQIGNWS